MKLNMYDAQQALGFLISQTSSIEAEVNKIQYPDYNYAELVPVDTSASEWAKTVTFYTADRTGKASWLGGKARDMALADVNRDKKEHSIHMAGIGYEYDLEELGTAQMTGVNLGVDRADAARETYEQFMYGLTMDGDTSKNMDGLKDYTGVSAANVAASGSGSSTYWADKTPDQILADVNTLLSGIWTDSLTVEIADTLLLPTAQFADIATRRLTDSNGMTVLEFIQKANIYTAQTGQSLMIRGIRGLENAGASSKARMIAYKRDPKVLKLHIPMPHRFLPVWQDGPMNFLVPGVFRTGGLEIRRPGAVRYADAIAA